MNIACQKNKLTAQKRKLGAMQLPEAYNKSAPSASAYTESIRQVLMRRVHMSRRNFQKIVTQFFSFFACLYAHSALKHQAISPKNQLSVNTLWCKNIIAVFLHCNPKKHSFSVQPLSSKKTLFFCTMLAQNKVAVLCFVCSKLEQFLVTL